MSVAGNIIDTDHGIIDADPRLDACGRSAAPGTKTWTASYLRKAAAVDGGCALAAGLLVRGGAAGRRVRLTVHRATMAASARTIPVIRVTVSGPPLAAAAPASRLTAGPGSAQAARRPRIRLLRPEQRVARFVDGLLSEVPGRHHASGGTAPAPARTRRRRRLPCRGLSPTPRPGRAGGWLSGPA